MNLKTSSDVNNLIDEWESALIAEKNYLKFHGGRGHVLSKGTPLYEVGNSTVMLFTIYAELFVPEGTPVRIKIGMQEIQGEILSLKGLTIEVKLNDIIKNTVDFAELYSEPWELIDKLIERLDEIKDYRKKQDRIMRLMNANSKVRHLEKMKKLTNLTNELILRSFYNTTTYIWGPPGTGKSFNLTKIILKHYERNKSVLVLAHSNAAVDVLMKNIVFELEQKNKWVTGEIVRYGYTKDEELLKHEDVLASRLVENEDDSYQDEFDHLDERKQSMLQRARRGLATRSEMDELGKIQNKLSKLRQEIRDREKELVDEAKIIGTTLSKCTIDPLIYLRQFDLIIVDEISMAFTPQVAFACTLGKRSVVCGDFKQLPPIASCYHDYNVKKWLQEDLFHHAGIVDSLNNNENQQNLVLLNEQRRMHQDISAFTNKEIYLSKVTDHPSVQLRNFIANKRPFSKKANVLIDSNIIKTSALKDELTNSRYNLGSSLISIQCLLTSIMDGVQSIGIVSPYRAQSKLLLSLRKDIIGKTKFKSLPIPIATVHRFQGGECDVIIFDSVDTHPQYSPGRLLTDQNSERLINVALTRARGKFINITDVSFMKSKTKKQSTINKLVNFQMNNSFEASNNEMNELLCKTISKRLKWFDRKTFQWSDEIISELKNAKTKIIVSMHNLSEMAKEVRNILNELEIPITFISEKEYQNQKNWKFIKVAQAENYLIIDNEILWYGLPIINSMIASNFIVRLQSPNAILTLKGFVGY